MGENVEYVPKTVHNWQDYNPNLIVSKLKKTMAGSLQSDWTDTATLDPISAWANEMLEEGLYYSPFASLVEKGGQLRRANKKQLYWMAKRVASEVSTIWATGVSDVHSYEHALDMDSMYIDPVEYRTSTPVAYESLDEVDNIPLEAHIRSTLAYYAQRYFTYNLYRALDVQAIDGDYDFLSAGNALDYCNGNTVDWGTQLTTDHIKSAIEAIVTDLYTPTDCLLPPAMYSDLFLESQFVNAAQYGSQNSAIIEGKIPRFMGVDFHLDTDIPDDSANADVGFMIDRNHFMGMVVANEGGVKVYDRWETGEYDFTMRIKLGCKVIQENAGCALYT